MCMGMGERELRVIRVKFEASMCRTSKMTKVGKVGKKIKEKEVAILWHCCIEGQHFQYIQQTVISVGIFITPKKSQHQQSIVCQAVKLFLLELIIENIQSKTYNPYINTSLHSEMRLRCYSIELIDLACPDSKPMV